MAQDGLDLYEAAIYGLSGIIVAYSFGKFGAQAAKYYFETKEERIQASALARAKTLESTSSLEEERLKRKLQLLADPNYKDLIKRREDYHKQLLEHHKQDLYPPRFPENLDDYVNRVFGKLDN